jgi:hypothetical protein
MAQIVLGIGSSHGPTIQSPASDWPRLGAGDPRDPRMNYEQLLKEAKPNMADELRPEVQEERAAKNAAGLARLKQVVEEANLDAVVVVSNPHRIWPDDNQPVFGVFRGPSLPVAMKTAERFDPDARFREGGRAPREIVERPGHPELANHLIDELIKEEFDVACAEKLREGSGLDEAFTLLYEQFLPEGQVPMVPFIVSRYLPYQASSKRCYELGGALRRAIESWESNARVGIMASGGLSHQWIDEELDHLVIDALQERDAATLTSLDRARLNKAPGTPEILNWVTVAGAMDPIGMTLVDYVPCYRSLAGTGHGVTFGYWK